MAARWLGGGMSDFVGFDSLIAQFPSHLDYKSVTQIVPMHASMRGGVAELENSMHSLFTC